jgi:site-specific DNA-methyltransferase (adenine-specific)
MEANQIICGDCLEVMKGFPDNSIDTIITDPPYGLKFMGKKWDYNVPSVEIWQECLRVLKPGGTALIFAGSRTQHRMAVNVEDAGFILKDCIMWLYGSGFPKAGDISKQIDKKAGRGRKVIGKKIDISSGKPSENMTNITAPATPEATLWNGWKSHGLKPAYEPILVAMKPDEGSYANNALKWGVAGLNIEQSRISYKGKNDVKKASRKDSNILQNRKGQWTNKKMRVFKPQGRYPANIILDEEAGRLLDEQSGVLKPPWGKESESQKDTSWFSGKTDSYGKLYRDIGGASRFFYCAKASKTERNRGCEGLEEKERANINKMMGKAGNFKTGSGNDRTEKFRNSHPTIKPLALMKYLCTLTKTPTGGIVLDPFCGSGTTLMACKELKRDYIGIEDIPEYCEIARRRVNAIPESLF